MRASSLLELDEAGGALLPLGAPTPMCHVRTTVIPRGQVGPFRET